MSTPQDLPIFVPVRALSHLHVILMQPPQNPRTYHAVVAGLRGSVASRDCYSRVGACKYLQFYTFLYKFYIPELLLQAIQKITALLIRSKAELAAKGCARTM